MAHISVHNVQKVKIEKYQLNTGTYVCRINCDCLSDVLNQESYEEITLFSENKKTFNKLVE